MLSVKQTITLALLILFIGLVLVDYREVASSANGKQSTYVYRASGIVDNLFRHSNLLKNSNVIEKNIFLLSEKPTNVNPVKVVNTQKNMNNTIELKGISITPDNRYAIVQYMKDSKTTILKEGESFNEYKVVKIFKDHIIARMQENTREIYLRKETVHKK